MSKFVLAFFLVAHGIIHLGYLTPAPADPKYPFRLSNSWLIVRAGIDAAIVRALGMALGVITLVGFGAAALAALGIVVPQAWSGWLTLVAATSSLVLLILFWHTWLVVGALIDVVMLAAVLGLRWLPAEA